MTNTNTFAISFADVALVLEQLGNAIVATGFYDADKTQADFGPEVLGFVKEERSLRLTAVGETNLNGWFIRASLLAKQVRDFNEAA